MILRLSDPTDFGIACSWATTAIIGVAIGIYMPVVPVVLDSWGVSPTLIGLNAASTSLAVFITASVSARTLARFGIPLSIGAGAALFAASVSILPFIPHLWAWFLIRFVLGIGIAIHWVGSEAWINLNVDEVRRGRVLAIYSMIFTGSVASGPIIAQWTGTSGTAPFLISGLVGLAAVVPIAIGAKTAPSIDKTGHETVFRTIGRAKGLMLTALMTGMAFGCGWALWPLYGLSLGFGESKAVLLLSSFLLGGLFLQYPIGWLSDRTSRTGVLSATAAAGGLLAICLLAVGKSFVPILILLFFIGGAVASLYPVALTLLALIFPAQALTAGNAAFVTSFELGMMSGAPVGGTAMDIVGPYGLPAIVIIACGFIAAFAYWLRSRGFAQSSSGPE